MSTRGMSLILGDSRLHYSYII